LSITCYHTTFIFQMAIAFIRNVFNKSEFILEWETGLKPFITCLKLRLFPARMVWKSTTLSYALLKTCSTTTRIRFMRYCMNRFIAKVNLRIGLRTASEQSFLNFAWMKLGIFYSWEK